jgi:hypothetical protein
LALPWDARTHHPSWTRESKGLARLSRAFVGASVGCAHPSSIMGARIHD